MNKSKLMSISLIAILLTANISASPAPTPPVRFGPTTLGGAKNELFTFTRFGVAPVGDLDLTIEQRKAFVKLVKTQDKLDILVHSGVENPTQRFTISLPPLQQKAYKALAPQFLNTILKCARTMPDTSAYTLLSALTGVGKLEPTDLPLIKADLDKALSEKCSGPSTNIITKPFEERALFGAESLLTGEFSIWFGGDNYISMLQGLGDSLFAKPNAVFSDVAYDYLKTTLTTTISAMGTVEGINQLTKEEGFTTFVDFLVVAKTKTSMPSEIMEAITEKCISNVSDLFKPFNLKSCGADTFSVRTISIGETHGALVSFRGE